MNTNGLTLTGAGSAGSTIRGLVINRFDGTGGAIRMLASSANNVIVGNYLGTNAARHGGQRERRRRLHPDERQPGRGLLAADRNVISGNTTDGIQINGGTATNNVVQNNYIGVDVINGDIDLGNVSQGVAIFGGADNNTVGGNVPAPRNVISGNNNDGVLIAGAGTTGNHRPGEPHRDRCRGYRSPSGNLRGIEISGGASGSTIGGAGARGT